MARKALMRVGIVGAGPSGSYAALLLSKQGHEVHVFEEHEEIGKPVQCTGIVTRGLWDLIPKERSLIKTDLKQIKIHAPNGKTTTIKLDEFVLDRAALDVHLAKLAKDAGAKYHLGHRFVNFEKEGIKIRHKGQEKIIPVDITVGADGPNSEVAKAAGIWKPRKIWGGVQATVEGKYDPNTFDVFFGSKYERFFGWAVPESDTVARVGVASQHKAREIFGRITEVYPGKMTGWQSGPIPIYDKNIPVQNKQRNVFLVGDAAGLVKATTGGGIITGMISSKLLVEALTTKKDYSKLLKSLRKDLHLHWLLRRMLNTFSDKDYDRLISWMGTMKVQGILQKYKRDFPSQFLTKLIFVQPKFLLFVKNFIKQLGLPSEGVWYG